MLCQILLIMHIIAKKRVMGKEREEKNIVVTSDGTLFCRLHREEDEKGETAEREEEEASKWDQLID